jgi:ABC-type multidrug transport system ATPase subunit
MATISVKNLSHAYGSVKAVNDFSFEVDRGISYALVGPDGAGKTTIIRALCNLLTPDAGEIQLGGIDIATDFDKVKRKLGYMPQTFSLYLDLSVEENLTFYGGIYGVTGARYVEKRNTLYEFSRLKPFADRRARDLSGGMKQKLALSCALIHDPELLILDEPTTGVDPLSRRQFWDILTEFKKQGVTIIVSTPYMDEVARTDRACFVFRGGKLAEGTPEELTRLYQGEIYYVDRLPTTPLLDKLNLIEHVVARRFGTGLHLYLDMGQHPGDIATEITQAGLSVEDLMSVTPDLEDSFIQLMQGQQ